jgi:hypothetical protein
MLQAAEQALQEQGGEPKPPSHDVVLRPLDVRELSGLIAGNVTITNQIVAAGRTGARDGRGDTPLHIAASRGHAALCGLLIDGGADRTSQNRAGKTPADLASERDHRELAVELACLSPEQKAVALDGVAPATHGSRRFGSDHFENADPHNQGVGAEAPVFEDLGEFVAEEEPEEYHHKQNITVVDGTFEAIVTVALRSGIGAESDDWSLPASLNSAVPVLGPGEAPHGELGSADDLAGENHEH